MDRARPLFRVGNRIEAFEMRHFGASVMTLLNRGDVLLLETVGRRTGRRRFAPVAFWRDDEGALFVGGGAAGMTTVPDWVRNLRASPSAAVWIRRRRVAVDVHELVGADRDRAQAHAATIWRGVPRYEKKSGRVIPYFRLVERTQGDSVSRR